MNFNFEGKVAVILGAAHSTQAWIFLSTVAEVLCGADK